LQQPTAGEFVAGLVLGTVAALVVFAHADRTGSRHATAWGIASFLFVPTLLVYFGRFWLRSRRAGG
jgi:hypothetical protein